MWCTMAVWQATRRVWARVLATVYPFVTTFAVVSTGNHFVVDVLGGLLTLALSVALVRVGEAARARRRQRSGTGAPRAPHQELG